MNAYASYTRHAPAQALTRIELLLALYDKALERLDAAEAAVRAGDARTALPLIAKTQLIVAELAAGVRVELNPDAGANMLRLYEFVTHQLTTPGAVEIAAARKVLRTLREGFEAVRAEANDMERTGGFVAASRLQMVLATA